MTRYTDSEVMQLLDSNTPLNKARQLLCYYPVTSNPIENRRIEFETVEKIAAALATAGPERFTEKTPEDGVIRVMKYPEGYRLWYHGECVWRSEPVAKQPAEHKAMCRLRWRYCRKCTCDTGTKQ